MQLAGRRQLGLLATAERLSSPAYTFQCQWLHYRKDVHKLVTNYAAALINKGINYFVIKTNSVG
jgi:hypothetical protein